MPANQTYPVLVRQADDAVFFCPVHNPFQLIVNLALGFLFQTIAIVNAKKEGVVTLPSGVQYKVLTKGTGALPTDSSVVKVNYEGKLIDGTKFDSSYDRNQPLEVNMATPRVIPGWVEVLKLMPAGSVWEVTIPQEQAYGMQNQGQIKPFSTLIFKMEVLK